QRHAALPTSTRRRRGTTDERAGTGTTVPVPGVIGGPRLPRNTWKHNNTPTGITVIRAASIRGGAVFFQQYYLNCLSQASYLVGDETTGRAVVVDPRRDISDFLTDARAHGLNIEGIINTHFHADFVAGHLEMAHETGAWIGYGRRATADYDFHPLAHGQHISLGTVDIEILETPGHTWESITLLVRDTADDEPAIALTGDTLFVGDVGRPDLAVSVGASKDELARALYRSLHDVLLTLPDDTLVYPAHGAGSACGKNISSELHSTIGAQRSMNPAVQPMSESEFVELITSGQPAIPG